MRNALFFALALLFAPLFGEEPSASDSVHAIVLVTDPKSAHQELEPFQGISTEGIALFERYPQLARKLQMDFIGRTIDQRTLCDLEEEIVRFYAEKNQLFVRVSVPSQNFACGIVKVIVEEAKLGQVRSKGNCYYTGTDLMGYIKTKPGDPIVMDRVLEDVAWMNKNPFRRTDAVFTPGKNPGTADLDLVTIDRWPYRVYVGSDNTGTIATEKTRLFFGFNFGKTIVPDADASYQFTFSPNWNRFFAHTASARIPCPWRHEALLWGGYSQVEPDIHRSKETGTCWQVDGRYRIPIFWSQALLQTIVLGYDFKETKSRIKEGGITTFDRIADLNQFMLGYEVGVKRKCLKTNIVAELYGNPGGITERNKKRDYQAFRFAARPEYIYLKVAHSLGVQMPYRFWFSYDLTGQVASRNLLPSEQFSLSGYHGVRGFEERIALVDNAVILNVAFETPHFSLIKTKCGRKPLDELYFLAFFDCGFGKDHETPNGEPSWKSLGSIGPGMRYQFNRYITGRVDYGFQLWHRGFHNPTHSRCDVGLMVSY